MAVGALALLGLAAVAGILGLVAALVYGMPIIVTEGGAVRYGLMGGETSEYRRRRGARSVQLRALDDLRTFRFRADGCYGPCPIFVLTVRRDGRATIDRGYPEPSIRSSAVVPWTDVLLMLRTAGVDGLGPNYPKRWVDTFGARVELGFTKGILGVDAPDEMTWPPQLFAVMRGTCAIVNRARWSPAIRKDTC